jgi:hypothetical protein
MKTLFTLLCAALLGFSISAQETNSAPNQIKYPSEFQFDGGSLTSFIDAVKSSFGIDLKKVATVPESMYGVRVPKLRLKAEGEAYRAPLSLSQLLSLYNSVSDKGDSSLGRWIMEAFDGGGPQTILLVPSGPRAESSFAVRAFVFPSSNTQEANRIVSVLQETITTQRDMLQRGNRYFGLTDADLRGGVSFHTEAGILVASGGKIYVEMASSIIEAYKEKMSRAEVPIPGKPKPDQP